ncbi:phenoloxidase-activating factor 3-like [Aricia agestis]|uniref:phenoloxidase-activating factor 3-like n=1 Tax=Aricia agestis TaxID=91739 RepID=UPI001C204451|nr:phenoloxidase-activating factor 3-like [Aricia agestis]
MRIVQFILLCSYGISQGKSSFGPCSSCVPVEECPFVRDLTAEEQRAWMTQYHCDTITIGTTKIYDGFSAIAKGDSVLCCPHINQLNENIAEEKPRVERKANTKYNASVINVRNLPEIHRRVRQVDNGSNPFFLKKTVKPPVIPPVNPPVNPPINPPVNPPNDPTDKQCRPLSDPPEPESGCCGIDTSDTDRITDLESFQTTHAPLVNNKWEQFFLPAAKPTERKINGSTGNKTNVVDLDPKISGGNETELEQYPWAVLLRIVFRFGNEVEEFTCGGSLISAMYVITAAHCVQEKDATLVKLDITLAEYDKRTFPNDCIAAGEGRKCIQNIVIPAQSVTVHPSYEETWLHNDIAVIKLRFPAPYTNAISPICLAPLNIDTPVLTNLSLAVAGWGQNRQFFTNVKQSTILKLISKEECEKSYPNISKDHICAVGSTGQDTCRGDSGGPLMVLSRGRYYLMGVVSGKRADSPCGSTVPSLFTNVFNYIDWIKGVLRRDQLSFSGVPGATVT